MCCFICITCRIFVPSMKIQQNFRASWKNLDRLTLSLKCLIVTSSAVIILKLLNASEFVRVKMQPAQSRAIWVSTVFRLFLVVLQWRRMVKDCRNQRSLARYFSAHALVRRYVIDRVTGSTSLYSTAIYKKILGFP